MKNTIFVQIASYRDQQLISTLNDLIENAKHPENLHITVCWQHGDDELLEDFLDNGFDIIDQEDDSENKLIYLNHIKTHASLMLIDLNYLKTKGACWARNKIQQYYNGEKYTLQLDSHHRFVKDWDKLCIEMIESLRDKSPKPILTAYIPSFDPENDPDGRVNSPWKMDFDRFIPEGAVFFRPSTIDDWNERTEPMLSRFYSAHFAFADGQFATEVQHDPEYFFHGEEISIAVRAFTHGYDLYHPHKVIAWHEYTRKGRIKVWDDHTTQQKTKNKIDKDWMERNNICHKRNRILFGMDGENPNQIDFGKYGFGKERSLQDYEIYSGLSFKHRSVTPEVIERKEPTLNPPKIDYDLWEKSLSRSNDVRVCIHKSELKDMPEDVNDYDFWYVGTHDKDGKEIFRKDLTPSEIVNYLRGDWIDYRLIFMSSPDDIPQTYTIWPHTKSKGWMHKIDKYADS